MARVRLQDKLKLEGARLAKCTGIWGCGPQDTEAVRLKTYLNIVRSSFLSSLLS